jgi:hypothetical protein
MASMIHVQAQAAPAGVGANVAQISRSKSCYRVPRRRRAGDLEHMVPDALAIEEIDCGEHPHPTLIDSFDADAVCLTECLWDCRAVLCPVLPAPALGNV